MNWRTNSDSELLALTPWNANVHLDYEAVELTTSDKLLTERLGREKRIVRLITVAVQKICEGLLLLKG